MISETNIDKGGKIRMDINIGTLAYISEEMARKRRNGQEKEKNKQKGEEDEEDQ